MKINLWFLMLTGVLAISSNAYAATHNCECSITRLQAGFVGGAGNSAKSKIFCSDGKNYAIGVLSEDIVKARHSMALAAQMSDKTVMLQYWSADGSLTCEVASSDDSILPSGFYIE